MDLAVEFPEFFLTNCTLRRIYRNDVEAIFAGLSNPQVVAHYGVSYDNLEATDEQMRWYDALLEEHRGIWWGITLPGRNELVGACGFNDWSHSDRSLEIGYWLMPEHWGRGLMRDCLSTILRFALSRLGVHRIHADVEPENPASTRLLERLGFVLEGTLRDVEYKNGRFLSLHQYSLLATDPAGRALLEDDTPTLRPSRGADARALSALAQRSKAHWGYPEAWMKAWEAALTFHPGQMTGHYAVLVAVDGRLLGFYGLENGEDGWQLEHCWVDPQSMGGGHGRRLVGHALAVVRGLGVSTLAVESDPSARGFYELLGARYVRDVPRPVCGEPRYLPILKWEFSD
ncbi:MULTISPECIES: GNAT family N-acetyltransferase [unclassified Pseudomonas]|uniref:GNAT family N-acetyltransferase n=1 Tax=unclassified Pseudomonas TaxID=196821 RepID=UPI000A1E2616|nr:MULTISPECIES: GNAT family N-acetyltransferase [unclassified Pseudomonas]